VAIDLTQFERGEPFAGNTGAALTALGQRIARAQLAQVIQGGRAMIVLEGLEGGGKTTALKAIAGALDPRFVSTIHVVPDRRRSIEGHWLVRSWRAVPEDGRTTLFFHSWYRRVLEDKVLGHIEQKAWQRAFDEINEFEAQQRDHGTAIVKLLFHVTEARREARLAQRQADPLQRMLMGPEELRGGEARAAYDEALGQTLAQTDTRWAPWTAVDANDSESAEVAAMEAVAIALEKAFRPEQLALDPNVVPLRRPAGAPQRAG
jgi:polyphosphate kinase 2 (PPK2 family)